MICYMLLLHTYTGWVHGSRGQPGHPCRRKSPKQKKTKKYEAIPPPRPPHWWQRKVCKPQCLGTCIKTVEMHCFPVLFSQNIQKKLFFCILDVKLKQTQCLLLSNSMTPLYCQHFWIEQLKKPTGFECFFDTSIEKHGVLMFFHQKGNESTVFSNQLCFLC